jgi:biopolymer transport protein ExbB
VEQGKNVRFNAPVVAVDGTEATKSVVRIGPFTAIADGKYLTYSPSTQRLNELGRQPASQFMGPAEDVENAQGGLVNAAIDPSRGALLSLLVQTASFRERLDQGGTVGYVIMALLVIGVLMALEPRDDGLSEQQEPLGREPAAQAG